MMMTSTSFTASATGTAVAPASPARSAIVSGPREFARRTVCPAALSLRARVAPMLPAPRIPIFMCAPVTFVIHAAPSGRRSHGKFVERVAEFGEVLVGQATRRFDLLGDAPGRLAQRFAGLREADEHPAFVGGIACARHQPGGREPLQQRRQ